jgi:hypothetical protein
MESISHQLKNFRISECSDNCKSCKHSQKHKEYDENYCYCDLLKYIIIVPKLNVCDDFK